MRWATLRISVLVFGWQMAFGCSSDQAENDSYTTVDSAIPNLMNSGGVEIGGQSPANSGGAAPIADGPVADSNLPEHVSQDAGLSQDAGVSQDAGASPNLASLVLPIERQGQYVLEFENLRFECSGEYGGRITGFEMEGTNVLAGTQVNADNFGSTFWTSPQNEWGWPPPAEIDQVSYSPEVIDNVIVLTGPSSPQLNLRVTKRFSADLASGTIVLQYTVENTGTEATSLAPWEVSRVHPGGLTFFPTGEMTYGSGIFQPLSTEEAIGVTWFRHNPEVIDADQKLLADGREGWIAHVAGDLIFIKTFPDVPVNQCAPEEGEIEIYANQSYTEVEQQGVYQQVDPQAQISWTVTWYLHPLPQGMEPTIGNQALVDFVRETIR